MRGQKATRPATDKVNEPRAISAGEQDRKSNKGPAEAQAAIYRRERRRLAQTLGRMDGAHLAEAMLAEQRAINRERRRLAQALGRTDDLAALVLIITQADVLAARAVALRLHAERRALRLMRSGVS